MASLPRDKIEEPAAREGECRFCDIVLRIVQLHPAIAYSLEKPLQNIPVSSLPEALVPGPLHGVRILELTGVVLGPWACQILGDLGADVVKVEPPGGDSNRQLGPKANDGMGALYLTCNRNKRSLGHSPPASAIGAAAHR